MDLILVLVEEEEEDFVTKTFFIVERLLGTTKNISIFTVLETATLQNNFEIRSQASIYTYYTANCWFLPVRTPYSMLTRFYIHVNPSSAVLWTIINDTRNHSSYVWIKKSHDFTLLKNRGRTTPTFVSVSIGQQHSYLPSLFEGEMTQAFANKVTMYPCQYYHHLIRRRSNT